MDDNREVSSQEVVTIEALQTRQNALDQLKDRPMPEAEARQQIEALGFTIDGRKIIMPDAFEPDGSPFISGQLFPGADGCTIG